MRTAISQIITSLDNTTKLVLTQIHFDGERVTFTFKEPESLAATEDEVAKWLSENDTGAAQRSAPGP